MNESKRVLFFVLGPIIFLVNILFIILGLTIFSDFPFSTLPIPINKLIFLVISIIGLFSGIAYLYFGIKNKEINNLIFSAAVLSVISFIAFIVSFIIAMIGFAASELLLNFGFMGFIIFPILYVLSLGIFLIGTIKYFFTKHISTK